MSSASGGGEGHPTAIEDASPSEQFWQSHYQGSNDP